MPLSSLLASSVPSITALPLPSSSIHSPFPLEELVWDCQILQPADGSGSGDDGASLGSRVVGVGSCSKFLSLIFFLSFNCFSFDVLGVGRQLTGPYAPAATPAMPPAEAQKMFVVPEGFEVRLFAAEPDVVNPVAMTWDERGRLWVVELYEYPKGAAPGTKPRDRIKILEDTDNDGRADKVTVFADGLNLATGILLGNGGAYVGQAPQLLFLQDTNHDDVADTRTTLLSGFALDDRHELLNGFAWGPDGWLYMTHGVFTYSTVKIPEASAPGVEVNAAVARFDPHTRQFEVFADGTSNPWGVDFDRYGNAYVSACVIDHLFHMAPGGIYARQGGVPGNPYAYELLPSIVGHTHHMAAYCGVCIYQGNQFPDTYRGHVFMGNIHQSAINHDRLTPNGSSFKAAAESDFLTTTDGWFRPVSEKVGPDGALWIADWYDKYPCYQNAQADPEGVDRQYGRIWRVVYAGGAKRQLGSRPEKNMDLGKLKDEQLVKLLEHPNIWHRRMAQRILGERSDHRFNVGLGEAAIHSRLKQLVLHGETLETCLAALWTLHQVAPVWNWDAFNKTAGVRPDFLAKVLSSNESAIRAWAVKLSIQDLARLHRQSDGGAGSRDAKERGHELFSWLSGQLERLGSDPDPSVRLAVATAIRQIVSSSLTVDSDIRTDIPTGRILTELIKSSSDAKDPLLPFMIWMAGEPSLAANPAGGLSWLAENGARTMPLSAILTRKAMRRICETQEPGKLDLAVDFLRTITEKDNALALAAMDGLLEGQKARPLVPGVDTKSLFDRLSATSNPELKERGQELGTLWGNAAAIQADLGAINDLNSTDEQRIKAIQSAKVLKNGAVRSALVKVIHNPNPDVVVIEAIRALGQIGAEDGANDFLGAWKSFTAPARAAAADTLTSRRRWAMALLSAIEAKIVSIGELPMTSIRALAGAKEDFMRDRAAQVIGRVRPANADKQKIIEQKKKMILAGGPPDLQAGHELAKKTCFVCHRLYGEGAEVGPDLTGVGRSTLDALLANVIDPNQVIGKGYENVDVETRDGRNVAGRLIENTDTRVKLLSSGPREDVIAKSDIQSMRVSEVSVMPEGLEQMPDADFRNLILYVLQPPREQKGP